MALEFAVAVKGTQTVSCIFENRSDAEQFLYELEDLGEPTEYELVCRISGKSLEWTTSMLESRARVEGEFGTWSHCGSTKKHGPHSHAITFNEGEYSDMACLGTK